VREEGRVLLSDVTFAVRAGEIFGIAGVEGNGQAALFQALTGTGPAEGTIHLSGQPLHGLSVADRRRRGLRAIPADRLGEGLLLDFPVYENLYLGNEHGWPERAKQIAFAEEQMAKWRVEPRLPLAKARIFSGGNQQKLLFAREMAGALGAFIVDQPTHGVDWQTQERIWAALRDAAAAGACLVVISSDLDELRALAAKVAVLFRGRSSPALPMHSTSDAELGRQMAGLSAPSPLPRALDAVHS
jgi:simple sugar transport system ATP-binding protein